MVRTKSNGIKVLLTYLLKEQGKTTKEIQEILKVSQRTIYRYVRLIKEAKAML